MSLVSCCKVRSILTYGYHGFQCQWLDCGLWACCWSVSISAQHLWLQRDASLASLHRPFRAKSSSHLLGILVKPRLCPLRIMLSLLFLVFSISVALSLWYQYQYCCALSIWLFFYSHCKRNGCEVCATACDRISIWEKKLFCFGEKYWFDFVTALFPFSQFVICDDSAFIAAPGDVAALSQLCF